MRQGISAESLNLSVNGAFFVGIGRPHPVAIAEVPPFLGIVYESDLRQDGQQQHSVLMYLL